MSAVAFALLISLNAAVSADDASAPRIDLNALAERAGKSLQQLRNTPATWVVRTTLNGDGVIEVSVVRDGDKRHIAVTFEHGGERGKMVDIIARDGLWYCLDRNCAHRYRPFEMPADTPFVYVCMGRSDPVFVVPGSEVLQERLEAADAHVATFRRPLGAPEAQQSQGAIDQLEARYREAGKPVPAELQANMDALQDLVAHGTPVRVDMATGQVIEFGSVKVKTRTAGFHLLAKADDKEFTVDDRKWQDCSDDPTTGNLNDLLMIGHAPGVQPGDKSYETDGRLMDVTTGRFRRLPFPGASMMPCCFLPGRRSVLITGMAGDSAVIRPYRLNLSTRECEPVGGPLLDSGLTLFGDVSPDGKRVVFVHKAPGSNMFEQQLCVFNLATGEITELGKPRDTACVNWTADNQHLVLLDRQYKSVAAPMIASIAVMDMNGKVTILRRGDQPVLLADRKTILYQDVDTNLHHTCDLDGQNDKLYGNGLEHYGFPSPAPDGQRILMMRFKKGELPAPVLLKVGASEGRVITTTEGLWAVPTWR